MAILYNQFYGLNTKKTPDDIGDFETPDGRNEDLSAAGVDKTRPGTSKVNTTALAGALVNAITGILTEDDQSIRIAFCTNGSVYTF